MVLTRNNALFTLFAFLSLGEWNGQGCYKEAKEKVLTKRFGRYRITGLVDKCKEAAEKLGYQVFGVGVRAIDLLPVTNATNIC